MVKMDPALGAVLTDATGMTVYLFTKDTTAGTSACTDTCATSWPPVPAATELLLPPGIPGALGALTQADGTIQLTYNDIPLSYFAGDKQAGDTTRQEVGNVCYAVTPGLRLGEPPHEAAATGTPASR